MLAREAVSKTIPVWILEITGARYPKAERRKGEERQIKAPPVEVNKDGIRIELDAAPKELHHGLRIEARRIEACQVEHLEVRPDPSDSYAYRDLK